MSRVTASGAGKKSSPVRRPIGLSKGSKMLKARVVSRSRPGNVVRGEGAVEGTWRMWRSGIGRLWPRRRCRGGSGGRARNWRAEIGRPSCLGSCLPIALSLSRSSTPRPSHLPLALFPLDAACTIAHDIECLLQRTPRLHFHRVLARGPVPVSSGFLPRIMCRTQGVCRRRTDNC